MSTVLDRKCPECGDRISIDARRCACGWVEGGRRGKSHDGPAWVNTCTWTFDSLRCHYPVGLFEGGESKGRCIFHRHTPSGFDAARIARESLNYDREEYIAAAKRQTYANGKTSPFVEAAREQIASKPNARRGGSFGNLQHWIDLCKRRAAQREPGQDEQEAA